MKDDGEDEEDAMSAGHLDHETPVRRLLLFAKQFRSRGKGHPGHEEATHSACALLMSSEMPAVIRQLPAADLREFAQEVEEVQRQAKVLGASVADVQKAVARELHTVVSEM